MADRTTKTLLTVIEVVSETGEVNLECDWNTDLHDAIDVIGPDGGVTDRVMKIIEELQQAFDEECPDCGTVNCQTNH